MRVEFAERMCYICGVAGSATQLRNELLNEPERLLIEFYRRAREATNNSPYLEFQKLTITPGAIHAERVTQSLLVRVEDVRKAELHTGG